MFQSLFNIDLFLITHILIFLAFLSYSWLYYDQYRSSDKKKYLYYLAGGVFLSLAWGGKLYYIILNKTLVIENQLPVIMLQALGVAFIAYVIYKEKVPTKPKLSSIFFIFNPFLTVISFVGSFLITLRLYKRVREGLNKQFMFNFISWTLLTVYFLIQVVTLSSNIFPRLLVHSGVGSFLWILQNLILFSTAVSIFIWIGKFIAFRPLIQMFFSIWRWTIIVSIVLSTFLSLVLTEFMENQIINGLEQNSKLVSFNLEQVEANNHDILENVVNTVDVEEAIKNRDTVFLDNRLKSLAIKNSNLDRIFILDENLLMVYDSNRPESYGYSVEDLLAKKTVIEKKGLDSYLSIDTETDSKRLIYQYSYPVIIEEEVIGIFNIQKILDDNYADLLKSRTGQEIMIIADSRRAASTFLLEDSIDRLENLPIEDLQTLEQNKVKRIEILNKDYYTSVIRFEDHENKEVASLILATDQEKVSGFVETVLYRTFGLTLVLTLLLTIPSALLAKRLEKNLSA